MKKKILIIDDKEAIIKIVSIYLSKDYDFKSFMNPIEALEWLEKDNIPDLIISDIRMPLMSGVELVDKLKSNNKLKFIPIIILSAEDDSAMRINLLRKGCDDYIVKPFNPLELKVRIKRILLQ